MLNLDNFEITWSSLDKEIENKTYKNIVQDRHLLEVREYIEQIINYISKCPWNVSTCGVRHIEGDGLISVDPVKLNSDSEVMIFDTYRDVTSESMSEGDIAVVKNDENNNNKTSIYKMVNLSLILISKNYLTDTTTVDEAEYTISCPELYVLNPNDRSCGIVQSNGEGLIKAITDTYGKLHVKCETLSSRLEDAMDCGIDTLSGEGMIDVVVTGNGNALVSCPTLEQKIDEAGQCIIADIKQGTYNGIQTTIENNVLSVTCPSNLSGKSAGTVTSIKSCESTLLTVSPQVGNVTIGCPSLEESCGIRELETDTVLSLEADESVLGKYYISCPNASKSLAEMSYPDPPLSEVGFIGYTVNNYRSGETIGQVKSNYKFITYFNLNSFALNNKLKFITQNDYELIKVVNNSQYDLYLSYYLWYVDEPSQVGKSNPYINEGIYTEQVYSIIVPYNSKYPNETDTSYYDNFGIRLNTADMSYPIVNTKSELQRNKMIYGNMTTITSMLLLPPTKVRVEEE